MRLVFLKKVNLPVLTPRVSRSKLLTACTWSCQHVTVNFVFLESVQNACKKSFRLFFWTSSIFLPWRRQLDAKDINSQKRDTWTGQKRSPNIKENIFLPCDGNSAKQKITVYGIFYNRKRKSRSRNIFANIFTKHYTKLHQEHSLSPFI